jgi:hypothetical protein
MTQDAVLRKLVSIATTQQKVISRIAQVASLGNPPVDPNLDYLKRAVDAAMGNAGINVPLTSAVQAHGDTYTVTISGMDKMGNTAKEAFLKNYLNQIRSQKPELHGKVNVFFN